MSITAKLLFGFMFEYNGHFDFRENAVGVRLLLSHLLFNQNGKHTLRRFNCHRPLLLPHSLPRRQLLF